MIHQYYLIAAVLTICPLAIFFGEGALRRCGIAIAVNWCLAMAFVLGTGVFDPWLWFIAIDFAAAFIILWQPARFAQLVLGCLYVIQIAMHGAYGFAQNSAAANTYLSRLDMVLVAQLLILGGWAVGHIYKGFRVHHGRVGYPSAAPSHREGVAK